jgi:hypothetical protein
MQTCLCFCHLSTDQFVVIEAPFTYTGKPKPLHFQEALCSKFGKFASKLGKFTAIVGCLLCDATTVDICLIHTCRSARG